MQKITLLSRTPVLNKSGQPTMSAYTIFQSFLEGMDIDQLEITLDARGRNIIQFEGPDEVAAMNLIIRTFGAKIKLEQLIEGEEYKGYFVDSSNVGFGMFVNIGLTGQNAFLSLNTLRDQLVGNKTVSITQIRTAFSLLPHTPISVKLLKIESPSKIRLELSREQVEHYKSLMERNLDTVTALRCTRGNILNALKKAGKRQAVIDVNRLGLYEYEIVPHRTEPLRKFISTIAPYLSEVDFIKFHVEQAKGLVEN